MVPGVYRAVRGTLEGVGFFLRTNQLVDFFPNS